MEGIRTTHRHMCLIVPTLSRSELLSPITENGVENARAILGQPADPKRPRSDFRRSCSARLNPTFSSHGVPSYCFLSGPLRFTPRPGCPPSSSRMGPSESLPSSDAPLGSHAWTGCRVTPASAEDVQDRHASMVRILDEEKTGRCAFLAKEGLGLEGGGN